MTDNRDTLAALIGSHLPIRNTEPYGDQTEPGEVFVEGIVELLPLADAVLAAGEWTVREERR